MKPKIKFENVYKKFKFHEKPTDKLLDLLSLNKKSRSFSALRNISFEVESGESIGVIGINGSGKSTLSNLLAQVVPPTSGYVEINGESSLIAIAAGLNNNLSGIENIDLKCMMLGIPKEEIEEITPKIIEFADIGDFIKQPVKNYSSGMKSRLGFAISVHTDPDILIIDEALSVGDSTFHNKCLNKINEFKEKGKTIFFISHSVSQIRDFSDRILWLHFGEIKAFGEKEKILKEYKEFNHWYKALTEEEKKQYRKNMIAEQFKKEQTTSISRFNKNGNKVKIKSRVPFLFQVSILLVILFFTVYSMFSGASFANYGDFFRKSNTEKMTINEEDSEIIPTLINQQGIVSEQDVSVYSDLTLTREIGSLDFTDEVFINEKVEDVLRIEYNNTDGYVDSESIMTLDQEVPISDLRFEHLLPLLPSSFSNSYSFFLAHLKMNYEEVKQNLRGISNESVDNDGRKMLFLGAENLVYVFNSDDVADTIIVREISTDDIVLKELIDTSIVKNDKENIIYTLINNFEVIIDLEERTIQLKAIEE